MPWQDQYSLIEAKRKARKGSATATIHKFPTRNMKRIIKNGTLGDLTDAVKTAKVLLTDMQPLLASVGGGNKVFEHLIACNDLQTKKSDPGPVIGVVGSTGAGKSSVINAILDEESLVPTNCMRACTAVITELSWNESDDSDKKYRAEVEFISVEAWTTDIRAVLEDMTEQLLDGREINVGDPETAVKLARMKAVYPQLDGHDLSKGPDMATEFTRLPQVQEVLGTTKSLSARTAESLYNQLQVYIDSNEKIAGGNQMETRDATTMSFWPLVKVVRIFTKSRVLESGLTLVDLPGVQDSNAARSAVADQYIQSCSGIWVVAPIARAVDDKIAEELLGTEFKQQLKLDGNYSQVTIVCSKTDVIPAPEAAIALRKNNSQFGVDYDALKACIADTERAKGVNKAAKDEITTRHLAAESRRHELWISMNKLKKTLRDAQQENMVSVSKSCLKLGGKLNISESGSDNSDSVSMPKNDAQKLYDMLDIENSELVDQDFALSDELTALTNEEKELDKRKGDLKCQALKLCIRARNTYSTDALKRQFALGMQVMDSDERGDRQVDPTLRTDYAAVARKFQVFCVSSPAYLALTGKTTQTELPPGFEDVEDTQIPALQQFAIGLADAIRAASCKAFLEELLQWIHKLEFDIFSAQSPLKLSVAIKQDELEHLDEAIQTLTTKFKEAERKCMRAVKWDMEKLLDSLEKAVESGKAGAEAALTKLFSHKREGGITYQTFVALCQPSRNGIFTTQHGVGRTINLNERLVKAFKDAILNYWSDVFSRDIGKALDVWGIDASAAFTTFIEDMGSRKQLRSDSLRALVKKNNGLLGSVLQTRAVRKKRFMVQQRKANRMMMTTLQDHMKDIYRECIETPRGVGRYQQMKTLVHARVTADDNPMFSKCSTCVETQLKEIRIDIRSRLRDEQDMVLAVKKEYRTLITGIQVFEAAEEVRDKLRDMLAQADSRFARSSTEDDHMAVDGPANNQINDGDHEMTGDDIHAQASQREDTPMEGA